jgi:hypothetical protein
MFFSIIANVASGGRGLPLVERTPKMIHWQKWLRGGKAFAQGACSTVFWQSLRSLCTKPNAQRLPGFLVLRTKQKRNYDHRDNAASIDYFDAVG